MFFSLVFCRKSRRVGYLDITGPCAALGASQSSRLTPWLSCSLPVTSGAPQATWARMTEEGEAAAAAQGEVPGQNGPGSPDLGYWLTMLTMHLALRQTQPSPSVRRDQVDCGGSRGHGEATGESGAHPGSQRCV